VQFPRGIQGDCGKLNFECKITTILCWNREPSTELRFSTLFLCKLELVCSFEVAGYSRSLFLIILLYLSGGWLGVDVRMDKRKGHMLKRDWNSVLKIC
jgi:hypothetical protein